MIQTLNGLCESGHIVYGLDIYVLDNLLFFLKLQNSPVVLAQTMGKGLKGLQLPFR